MKRISKLLILAILCTVCCVLFACGGKVDGIYFETEPRKTYVQGQEFTLEDSVLVAMSKNKTTPIDAAEVSISGYNKDQLGNQTVTITYGEQTLTYNVTVIPRIAFEGIVRDYFVGDSFDKTKGRLKIADDQANTKSVNLSEESVTVEGFDSTQEGPQTITVKYGEYTGTTTVTVYTAETVELTTSSQTKKTYYSHDTEFNVKGAFFTVTANNGSLTRMIEVTPDMVTGFRPSDATIENMDTPLQQTVKFNYLGRSFDFKITVRFSGVSLALLRSEELKDVTPETATEEQNIKALDALRAYADLTPIDQALVDSDAIQKLLEIGLTYGVKLFNEEAETFANTIKLTAVKDKETKRTIGNINIVATSYEAVKADLERLEDMDVLFLDLAATLYELKEAFYFKKIGEVTIDELLGNVFQPDAIEDVTKAFNFLLELYEKFEEIPEDWEPSDLANYENEVREVVAIINASDYKAFEGSATIYSILSSWRTKNDYFEIIYGFYFYNDRTNMTSALWEKIYLPGGMQDLFTMHNFACQEAFNMRIGDDTSTFMYYYARANEIAEQIKANGSDLHNKIYNFFQFDDLIKEYLFFGTEKIQDKEINNIAYVYHASSLLDNANYEKILADFFELFKLSMQDGFTFQDEGVKELAISMLDSYAAFSPSERFAFLSSLHCDYRYSTSSLLILAHTVHEDGVIECFNYFAYLIYSSFKEALSADAYDLFSRLMEASEMYALRYHNPDLYNGFTDANNVEHLGFLATMAAIIEDAKGLSEADKAPFASLLAKLTEAYEIETDTPTAPVLTEEQNALFEELKASIETFYAFYYQALEAEEPFKYYIIAFSAFERAKSIISDIRAIDNADVLYALNHVPTPFNISFDGQVGVKEATYDYMFDEIGSVFYLTTLRTSTEDGSDVCTHYWYSDKIAEFIYEAYDVFLAIANGTIDETYLNAIRDLDNSVSTKYLFDKHEINALKELGAWDYYEAAIEYLKSHTAA